MHHKNLSKLLAYISFLNPLPKKKKQEISLYILSQLLYSDTNHSQILGDTQPQIICTNDLWTVKSDHYLASKWDQF